MRFRGKGWELNAKISDDSKLKNITRPEDEISCFWKIQERKHDGAPANGRQSPMMYRLLFKSSSIGTTVVAVFRGCMYRTGKVTRT